MDYYDVACEVMRWLRASDRGTAARVSKTWHCAFLRDEPELVIGRLGRVGNVAGTVYAFALHDTIRVLVGGHATAFYMGKQRGVINQVKVGGFWTLDIWLDSLSQRCDICGVTRRTIKQLLLLVFFRAYDLSIRALVLC